jgi:AraC-like DNA-binding protein
MDMWLPAIVSMGCTPTIMGGGFSGHIHAEHDELCLLAGDGSRITHAGIAHEAGDSSLYLFRRGELHAYANGPRQAPDLWIIHYQADEALYRACPRLAAAPRSRIWHLDENQQRIYRGYFRKILAERMGAGASAPAAAAGWLRLLLVTLDRWAEGGAAPDPTLGDDPELDDLCHYLGEHLAEADAVARSLARRIPNYDSLRHRFRAVFGMPPRRYLARLRIEQARHLLLETDLTMAQVADRLGFARQHEFARAFRREVGCPPSAFRRRPVDAG